MTDEAGIGLRLRWWREAATLRVLWALAATLSPQRASALGRRVMRALGPRTAKHRHVVANLRMLCPGEPPARIEALARESWGHLGATLAEFVHLDTLIDRDREPPAVELVCEHPDPDFLVDRKPCVFVSCHLGNWELAGWAVKQFGFPVDFIYNPQVNRRLDDLVIPRRKRLGVGLVPKRNALRRLMKSLKQGRSAGVLVDVRVEDAPLVPFAGAEATTTMLPAWLARKFGCDIVPIHCERVGDARFRVTLHPPVAWRDAEAGGAPRSIEQLSLEMNERIAALLRARPEQWLCTKRRWPKQTMRERGAYGP